LIGQAVEVVRFQDLVFGQVFDGIWASASLVHVPRSEMDDVFGRFTRALKPGGVLYMSFKYGHSEGFRNGRLFHDTTEEGVREMVQDHPSLTLVRIWQTEDVRSERKGEMWVNALARRHCRRPEGERVAT
jgi:hypothetical protein